MCFASSASLSSSPAQYPSSFSGIRARLMHGVMRTNGGALLIACHKRLPWLSSPRFSGACNCAHNENVGPLAGLGPEPCWVLAAGTQQAFNQRTAKQSMTLQTCITSLANCLYPCMYRCRNVKITQACVVGRNSKSLPAAIACVSATLAKRCKREHVWLIARLHAKTTAALFGPGVPVARAAEAALASQACMCRQCRLAVS